MDKLRETQRQEDVKMGMFCFQCQETAGNKGCTVRGVCGKTEDVSKRMDLLLYVCKGISHIVVTDKLDVKKLDALNGEMLTSLFMTITNANFDADAIERQIIKMLALRDSLRPCKIEDQDAANFTVSGTAQMLKKADKVGVLSTENEDVRSLRELVMYGPQGACRLCGAREKPWQNVMTTSRRLYMKRSPQC